jgi:hypothetical protein
MPSTGSLGEKKKLGLRSPSPPLRPLSIVIGGCEITGRIQRVIRFQSSLSLIGMTGWMLRTSWG